MRLFCLFTVLLLSTAEIALSQSTGNHLTEPGARRKFIGISHVEIDLGQRNTMIIGFDQYVQARAHQNIDSVLRLFVADYRKVEDTILTPTRAIHALLKLNADNRDLAVRYTPQPATSFRFRDGENPVEVKTQQDTLQIAWVSATTKAIPTDFAVYLMVNSLQDINRLLNSGGVNSKVQQALESIRQYKQHDLTNPRYALTLMQSFDNKPTFRNPGLKGEPFLSFHPGIGVGLIRNQWVPSFNVDLEIVPNRFQQVGYFVGYTSNFFFQPLADNSFQTFRNDFVHAGVSFYRKDKGSRTTNFNRHIASFYVGVPVYRSGNYFDSNTIKLGSTVYQNWLFKVQTEVYMNGFFKKVIPSLRLVVGF
ncbi:hypothetical protein IC229_28700 [Spirosoma sp. BT702]|uniref:Uncharacterized protein n=1 Tax=Spirosoma profusum TaxID=2771354 RepID=A0A927ASY0_9BACT|nr:hypothetical protein [Spirosoma profusum]MBD2704651.1 hypothetical protein [Spirosoma profusum]